jgi:hypothetical protein
MRVIRSTVLRAMVSAWGLWFTVLSADSAALHSCPMHDGAAAGGHSAHIHMAAQGADTSAPAKHDAAAACTCMGPCCSSAPTALASQHQALREITSTFVCATPAGRASVVPQLRAHALPFANAPPSTSAI